MLDLHTVENLANQRIEELNRELYIVDLSISSKNIISLELDRLNGSVSVEDCISVSRNIEHNLDREINDFELNVSSAGLDKPLRHKNQFQKNLGKNIEVLLKSGILHTGVLVDFSEGFLNLEIEKLIRIERKKKKEKIREILQFNFLDIKEVKVKILFK